MILSISASKMVHFQIGNGIRYDFSGVENGPFSNKKWQPLLNVGHARFAFLLKASGLVDGQKPSIETQSARRKIRALCVSNEGFWPRRRPKRVFRRALCVSTEGFWPSQSVSIEGFRPSTRPKALSRNAKRACLSARAKWHMVARKWLIYYWNFATSPQC